VSTNVFRGVDLACKNRRAFDGVQHKKIRCGPVGGDLMLYDMGSLIVATDDCNDTSDLGKVYLHYHIRFVSPQTSPSVIIPSTLVVMNLSADQTFTTATPAALDFDEALVEGFSITNNSGVYTMPCGAFELYGVINVADSAAENLTVVVQLYVDGAAVSPDQSSQDVDSIIAGGNRVVPFHFYHSSSVTFTTQIRVTLTGAAGTLLAQVDKTRLFIKAL
jgi:hypothetical protein